MRERRVREDVFAKLLEQAVDHTQIGVTITDPNQDDNPIIYCNDGFLHLSGYEKEEVIGKNCRFLQGANTNRDAKEKIKSAIRAQEQVSVEIINYRKNGEEFWNDLHIDPIYIEEEGLYYFVGIQKDITEQKKSEEQLKTSLKEITALSTPIVPITEGVSVLPLIGNMDMERLQIISDNITKKMTEAKHETLIMELSGLNDVDDEVIHGIFRFNDVLQLLGTDLVIAGISPQLALKATQLDLDLSSMKTFATVKEAIQQHAVQQ
ncbi:PAS domain-containing protein [Pontibacillus sp. HMF3514]|uniref:PAS domain-containing protein n=1 Tax=Pontibacillus sp. HMF3514 TaxID=2692425 RepID=UPI00131F54B7|nr:PAS domain-containing protein [Pontibacillus sp. HMF3514]QHE50646.1 PAS domain-containing protein [Pontibacillus sp. HMF3514]